MASEGFQKIRIRYPTRTFEHSQNMQKITSVKKWGSLDCRTVEAYDTSEVWRNLTISSLQANVGFYLHQT